MEQRQHQPQIEQALMYALLCQQELRLLFFSMSVRVPEHIEQVILPHLRQLRTKLARQCV